MKLTDNWEGRNYVKQSRAMKWYNFKLRVKSFLKKLLFWTVIGLILVGTYQYLRWAYPTEIIK